MRPSYMYSNAGGREAIIKFYCEKKNLIETRFICFLLIEKTRENNPKRNSLLQKFLVELFLVT